MVTEGVKRNHRSRMGGRSKKSKEKTRERGKRAKSTNSQKKNKRRRKKESLEKTVSGPRRPRGLQLSTNLMRRYGGHGNQPLMGVSNDNSSSLIRRKIKEGKSIGNEGVGGR